MQKINYIKASQITSTDGLARFCIFQNVSSTFARFIGEAKGDIRISQLNTFFRICFILIYFFECDLYIFYSRADVSIVLPTTHPPQAVPLLSQEKAINTKNALHLQDTAYIKRLVYIKCALKTE